MLPFEVEADYKFVTFAVKSGIGCVLGGCGCRFSRSTLLARGLEALERRCKIGNCVRIHGGGAAVPGGFGRFSSAPEDGRHHTADLASPLEALKNKVFVLAIRASRLLLYVPQTDGKERALIRINYAALRKDESESIQISDELLKKAKRRFGFSARKELLGLLSSQLRLQAMEVAARQMNPQLLYDAGMQGVLNALKVYDIGQTDVAFKDFAMPFVRTAMQSAKASR